MAIQRRGHLNLHSLMDALQALDDPWQVPLQVQAQGQEIGNDDDAPDPLGRQAPNHLFEARLSAVEERRLDSFVLAGDSQLAGDFSHGNVGRFNARTVSEDNERGVRHRLLNQPLRRFGCGTRRDKLPDVIYVGPASPAPVVLLKLQPLEEDQDS